MRIKFPNNNSFLRLWKLSLLKIMKFWSRIYFYTSSESIIKKKLNKLDIKTTTLPSKMIRELVHSSSLRNIFSDVYFIHCKNCKLKYIVKTSRKLDTCLKEHKRDIRFGNANNVLFQNISQSHHNFDFNSAKILIYIHDKRLKTNFRSRYFLLSNSLNTRPDFYNISP